MMDVFIHPNYVSATSPAENPLILGLIATMVGLILLGIAIWVHSSIKERRRKYGDVQDIPHEKEPPPV
jgi:hypothetical protein